MTDPRLEKLRSRIAAAGAYHGTPLPANPADYPYERMNHGFAGGIGGNGKTGGSRMDIGDWTWLAVLAFVGVIVIVLVSNMIGYNMQRDARAASIRTAIAENCWFDGESAPVCRFVDPGDRATLTDIPAWMSGEISAYFRQGGQGLSERPAAATGKCLVPEEGKAYCIDEFPRIAGELTRSLVDIAAKR